MSKFKKGDTVWMGRGDKAKKMIVDRVIDNHLIPIYQYTFEAPHNGFACGEQSIRKTENGADLKLSDCYKKSKDKEATVRINTIASAKRTLIEPDDFGVGNFFKNIKVDFKPSLDLAKWIVDYAQNRLIIHVGAGQGHLVRMLKMRQGKAIGIEPNLNKMAWIEQRINNDRGSVNFDVNEMLEGEVEDYKSLISSLGKNNQAILVIARPKVKDFVKSTLSIMPSGMELLYATTDELPFVQNDPYLANGASKIELLNHNGVSEDNESIYSIIK